MDSSLNITITCRKELYYERNLGENYYFIFCTIADTSILMGDPNTIKTYNHVREREVGMYSVSIKSTTVNLIYENLTSRICLEMINLWTQ